MSEYSPDHKERHEALWEVCRTLPSDFEPWGERDREAPDCSWGCRYFHPLAGLNGADWGVCFNPASPRLGLLTFEHQGCSEFDGMSEGEMDELYGID